MALNARSYFTLLRESTLLIAGCVAACLILAGVVTVLTPKSYASSMTFYVVAGGVTAGQQNLSSDTYQGAQLSQERIKSYAELVTGRRVAADAASALGPDTSPAEVQSKISASTVDGTVILTVTVTDQSPDRAATIASAVSDSFTQLVRRLETPRAGAQVPVLTMEVVDPPAVPDAPVTPQLAVNLIIGLLLGLLIGFGAAIARRSMDVSVKSTEILEDAAEAAVFGVVPEDKVIASDPVSLATSSTIRGEPNVRAEAYRRIRTNLEFSNVDGTRRVLVVTSALPGDGKTITACNLAAALAAVGSRVVLVDGDLRQPRAAGYLGLDASVGLASVLTGEVALDGALQTWAAGGFDVLVGGRTPPQPNELLSSRRAGEIIDDLRSRYDFVLIDAPPILPVADAVNLGTHADGAIVVCRWGKTSRHHVQSAVSFLRSVSVPVVGTVLSRAPYKHGATRTHYSSYAATPPGREPTSIPTQDLAPTNGSQLPHSNSVRPKPVETAQPSGTVPVGQGRGRDATTTPRASDVEVLQTLPPTAQQNEQLNNSRPPRPTPTPRPRQPEPDS